MTLEVSLYWFESDRITPVRFYPYTTIVENNIFWLNETMYGDKIPQKIKDTFQQVKEKALSKGAKWDNKVALECVVENFPHPIFMGYKDHALVLGFSVHHDTWVKPIDL